MVSTKKPAAGEDGKRAADGTCSIVRTDDSVFNIAIECLRSAISIIPIRCDGSKAPLATWQSYQKRYATEDQVEQWFSHRCGIGIVCGEISGGLEVLDFDDGTLFYPWFHQVPEIACRLPIIETPSDGYHVIYRCEEIGHNTKIAVDPKQEKQALIETRGEGGYIVGVGSPLGVHERKNRTYVQVMGPPLPEIPYITPLERRELWVAARRFDKRPQKKQTQQQPKRPYQRIETIDQFNSSPDWAAVLPGWTSRDGIHWTRPGKKYGCSAKTCTAQDGTPLLTVYSTNAGLEAQSYNAFELLVRNCFRGDRRAALQFIKESRQ